MVIPTQNYQLKSIHELIHGQHQPSKNSSMKSLSTALISEFIITLINLFMACLIMLFVLAVLLYKSEIDDEDSNSKECFNRKNISGLITKIYIVIKIIMLPCLVINLTGFNSNIQNQIDTFTTSPSIFALATFNLLFILAATLLYSEGISLCECTVRPQNFRKSYKICFKIRSVRTNMHIFHLCSHTNTQSAHTLIKN